jgi:hypothetical protein
LAPLIFRPLGTEPRRQCRLRLLSNTVPAQGCDESEWGAEGLIPEAKLVIYDGGSHGLLHVDKDRLNADLRAFLRN